MAGSMQSILDAVAAADGPLAVSAIAAKTELTTKRVADACGRLRHRGLFDRPETGHYGLTDAGIAFLAANNEVKPGPCGPLKGRRPGLRDSLRARVWKALRAEGKGSIPELLQLAGRGGERDPAGNARPYLNALVAAGYVAVLARRAPGTAPTSPGFKRYSLIRDPGPKPPVWSARKRQLHDPNSGETHVLRQAQDEESGA